MNIWVASPPGYVHSQCFLEHAYSLRDSFRELNCKSNVVTSCPDGPVLIFGGHLLPATFIHPKATIYNLEQIELGSPWLTENYVSLLKRFPVWDYSEQNIERLASIGVKATLLKIGYMPSLTRIKKIEPVYDVLFYGSLNDRRKKILNELHARGVAICTLFGAYGAERDEFVSKSQIVLNLHYYDAKVWEITRCMDLFANKVSVVSEYGHGSEPFHDTGGFCHYDELVDKCIEVMKNPEPVGQKGFDIFSQMDQTEYLRGALCSMIA